MIHDFWVLTLVPHQPTQLKICLLLKPLIGYISYCMKDNGSLGKMTFESFTSRYLRDS